MEICILLLPVVNVSEFLAEEGSLLCPGCMYVERHKSLSFYGFCIMASHDVYCCRDDMYVTL